MLVSCTVMNMFTEGSAALLSHACHLWTLGCLRPEKKREGKQKDFLCKGKERKNCKRRKKGAGGTEKESSSLHGQQAKV